MKMITPLTLVLLGALWACGGEEPERADRTPPASEVTTDAPSSSSGEQCLERECASELSRCSDDCVYLSSCVFECPATPEREAEECISVCLLYWGDEAGQQLADVLRCNQDRCS